MSRMLDLIRANSLSWHQLMTASKGALQVPAGEMVEILVYLAEHNKIMAGQARLTLAAWDEVSAKAIASHTHTPKEVLDYWLSPKNLRPPLFPLLIENPSVTLGKLSELAISLKGEWIDVMISSPRVRGSQQLLADLSTNKQLTESQFGRVRHLTKGPAVAEAEPILIAPAAIQVPAAVPAAPEVVATAGGPATELVVETGVEIVPLDVEAQA